MLYVVVVVVVRVVVVFGMLHLVGLHVVLQCCIVWLQLCCVCGLQIIVVASGACRCSCCNIACCAVFV